DRDGQLTEVVVGRVDTATQLDAQDQVFYLLGGHVIGNDKWARIFSQEAAVRANSVLAIQVEGWLPLDKTVHSAVEVIEYIVAVRVRRGGTNDGGAEIVHALEGD